MAGLKPSVNLFALLDRSDPGDKRLGDLAAANAKNTAARAAAPGEAYPSARDHVIRQNQLEKKAKARKRAAARAKSAGAPTDSSTGKTKIKADGGAKRGGYSNSGPSRKQQSEGYNNSGPSRKQQSGTSGGYKSYDNKGASGRQQPGMAEKKVPGEGVEAPPAAVQAPPPPPPPPSIYDIDEFPSLR